MGFDADDWGRSSNEYDQKIGPHLTKDYAKDLIEKLDLLQEHETLEIAAGTGQLTLEIAKRARHVLATDISKKMLLVLKKRLIENQIANVKTAEMNGEKLGLDTSTFDRVVCMFGLMLFDSPDLGIREIKRVLKPLGQVAISVWGIPDHFEMMQLFANTTNSFLPNQLRLDLSKNPAFKLSNASHLKGLFIDAEFSSISIDTVSHEKSFASIDDLWAILASDAPPLKWFTDALPGDQYTALRLKINDACVRNFGHFPIQLESEALLLSAKA